MDFDDRLNGEQYQAVVVSAGAWALTMRPAFRTPFGLYDWNSRNLVVECLSYGTYHSSSSPPIRTDHLYGMHYTGTGSDACMYGLRASCSATIIGGA